MKKIAIMTLPGNFNYGNRLQNYALEQVIIKNFGEVETIIVDNRPGLIKILSWIKLKKYELSKLDVMKQKKAKKEKFTKFTNNYLHNIIQNEFDQYDHVIVGSDQVWNPTYMKKTDGKKWFLDFIPQGKRISYAASFGVSKVDENHQELFKSGLNGIETISVREQAGVDIVKVLTGRNAELVVDPTMLLEKKDWEQLINAKNQSLKLPEEDFIIVYMLRDYTQERRNAVNSFANDNKFKIIQVMGDKYDENHIVFDPIEFIEAIKKSKMVITDSFHCAVFSIIFNTPFCVFERVGGNMGSRLQTLLKRFDLLENQYQGNGSVELQQLFEKTDFSNVEFILTEGRNKGIQFLEKALE